MTLRTKGLSVALLMRAVLLMGGLALTACGGGAGDTDPAAPLPGDSGDGEGGGGGVLPPTASPGPQIALLVVSGHSFNTIPSYLEGTAGPFLSAALGSAGYTVQTSYFTDDPGGGTPGGYAELLAKLQSIFEDWIDGRSDPTRIVIVPHSHGGVRTNAAIRASPLVPIRLLAGLDTSSNGWALVHPGEGTAMGGEPIDAYVINATITCPDYPAVGSEAGFNYDLEDVIFGNVEEALEVRTGDVVINPLQFEEYDERWNARLDGSTVGLTCYFSNSSHMEPTLPTGTTLPFVRDWILGRLAND